MALHPISWILITAIAVGLQYVITNQYGNGYTIDLSPAHLYKVLIEDTWKRRLVEKSVGDKSKASVQPDDYDDAAEAGDSRVDKCEDHRLPASSSLTTNCIELRVTSTFMGSPGLQYQWKYDVQFVNHGPDTVQMLARHWIFTDAHGRTDETKGPGARGHTPVIAPGETWSYTSGSTLPTSWGSMRGSFQIETLARGSRSSSSSSISSISSISSSSSSSSSTDSQCTPGPETFFSARVARLALTNAAGDPVKAPCGDEAPASHVPATSVRSTERIIIGASLDFVAEASKPERGEWAFRFDVQINNARAFPIVCRTHQWRIDPGKADGAVVQIRTGLGLGGFHEIGDKKIEPQAAFRFLGLLIVNSPSPRALIDGEFGVELEEGGMVAAKIGRLAASADGQPIDPKEGAGFSE